MLEIYPKLASVEDFSFCTLLYKYYSQEVAFVTLFQTYFY